MTLTRLLAAAGCAALLAGAAHAQTASTTTSVDQNGVQTTTTVNPATGVTTTVDPVTGMTTTAPAATTSGVTTSYTGAPGTLTTQVVTNGPVPDTPENRAKYGQPLSHAGKRTTPAGN